MRKTTMLAAALVTLAVAGLLIGQKKESKAPEQGYVPEAWYPHEGGLMKYGVDIRFGMEPAHTMPEGWFFGRVSAVTSDENGEIYVFHRNTNIDPVVVFDHSGKYLRSWGKGLFDNPHGIRIGPDGNVWCVDNRAHQVRKFTPDGKLLMTLGERGKNANDKIHFGSPTDIAWDRKTHDFYISDGYGNSRVMKFNKDGEFLLTWGKPGSAPGEFQTVHAVATDSQGRVYVSDRSNERIQIFTPEGEFLKQWTHLGATQGLDITNDDQVFVMTHRNKEENIVYDTLAGRIMKIDIETGKVLGAMESPGHMLDVNDLNGEILIGSLTGNALRWYPSPTFERLRHHGRVVQPRAGR